MKGKPLCEYNHVSVSTIDGDHEFGFSCVHATPTLIEVWPMLMNVITETVCHER